MKLTLPNILPDTLTKVNPCYDVMRGGTLHVHYVILHFSVISVVEYVTMVTILSDSDFEEERDDSQFGQNQDAVIEKRLTRKNFSVIVCKLQSACLSPSPSLSLSGDSAGH